MDLINAAINNDLERVKLLVKQGAVDKNKGDSKGRTPLYRAFCKGYVDVLRYLVEQGATLDKAENNGTTPLTAASISGQLEAARYLLEQGADRDKAMAAGAILPSTMLPSTVNWRSRCCS